MSKAKQIRKRIAGLETQIAEHQAKIQTERDQSYPNQRDIAHWEKEIGGWQEQIRKRRRHLPSGRKRGG